jgi:hypothetical protein
MLFNRRRSKHYTTPTMYCALKDYFKELTPQIREQLYVPRDGLWYCRQTPALELKKTNGSGFVVAWDIESGGMVYGYYESAEEFYKCLLDNPKDKRYAYEVIPEGHSCKGYLLVSWLGPIDAEHDKLKMISKVLRAKIKSTYNKTAALHVLCASTRTANLYIIQHSYHIVVENVVFDCNHDGKMKAFFSLDTTEDWFYTTADGKRKSIIDLGAYTKNKPILMPLCFKANGLANKSHENVSDKKKDLTQQSHDNVSDGKKDLVQQSHENGASDKINITKNITWPRNDNSLVAEDSKDITWPQNDNSLVAEDSKDVAISENIEETQQQYSIVIFERPQRVLLDAY